MYDHDTFRLAIRSRAARSVGLTMTGITVVALAFGVASPAAAGDRHSEHDRHVGCSHRWHRNSHRHWKHGFHHYRHASWHSGFDLGLFLPHFTLRLDHPRRSHRSNHREVRHHYRGHRERTQHRDRTRDRDRRRDRERTRDGRRDRRH